MRTSIATIILTGAVVLIAGAAEARKNKGGPCAGRFTTSLSVNNPECKPKNPPPVMEDSEDDSLNMGHGGKRGGAGKGGGGKGKGGGKGGGGKGGGGKGKG